MRIGIIGGGAAGLACAWLLDGEHDVTLFEKDDRLGGHAHTIEIEVHRQRIAVDAGFQFFASSGTYATFNRLLDLLEVPRRTYPATLTVYDSLRQRPVVMPPFRERSAGVGIARSRGSAHAAPLPEVPDGRAGVPRTARHDR